MNRTALLVLLLALGGCSADGPSATPEPSGPNLTTTDIDGRPSAVAVTAGKVWVTDDANHVVHVLDASSLESVDEAVAVEKNPIAIEAVEDQSLWVAHAGGEVVQIDASTLEVTGLVETEGSITGLALDAPTLWAADLGSDELVAIDMDEGEVDRRIAVPEGAVRVTTDGRSAWVSGRENMVTRVGPKDDATKTFRTGNGPIGLAWNGTVWSADSDDDTVTPIEPRGEPVEVGGGPIAIEFSTDGTMWVANQDDSTLSIVRDGEQVGTVDLEVTPREMASVDDTIWVVGTNREGLVRVDP